MGFYGQFKAFSSFMRIGLPSGVLKGISLPLYRAQSVGLFCLFLPKLTSKSTKTNSASKTSSLDKYWMTLRVNQLASIHCKKLQTSFNNTSSGTTFSDAKDLYLKLKGQGKGESFVAYSERNFGYLVEAVGNKDLIDYKPADGGVFRDWLTEKGLASSSVKRVFCYNKSHY